MRLREWVMGVLCAVALWGAGQASAATVSNVAPADFLTGISTGAASPVIAARTGGIGGAGIVMQPGAPIINDDFSYASTAAATSAGWQFLLPNGPDPAKTTFSFPGNGALRFHVWKQQDFWNSGLGGQDQPVLAMNSNPITGDFVAETKFHVLTPRVNDNRIQGGIIVTLPSVGSVTIDGGSNYYVAAAQNADDMITFSRWYPQDYPWPVPLDTGIYTGDTVTVRVVRSGANFHSFFRTSDTGPWIESGSFAVNPLKTDPNQPVLIGLIAKAWGGPDDYQDTDFDYFKVNQLATVQTGTFSNVMDAGVPANWQSLSLVTQNMTGLKFQVRGGNAVSGGTLTDGGSFVGPDNTAGTYYQSDVANILPSSTQGKRYLEYKLSMDAVSSTPDNASVINLPTVVMNITATYQPAPVAATFLTDKADFGPDTATVAVQNGDGDLGLKRTLVYRNDFDTNTDHVGDMTVSTDTSDWLFDSGSHNLDPTVVGNYSWNGNTGSDGQATPGPAGWLRIETGYMQDIYAGAKGGGVRMFHTLSGLTDFEVETEVKTEAQNNRMSGLYVWMNDANFIGISVSRRFPDTLEIGLEDDGTINNAFLVPDMIYTNYGTNHVFLRITKKGQILTLSYRDADSPSWKTHRVYNLTGMASGGADFTPVLAGLMTKSFDHADRDTKFADYNYFQISSVADAGTKDLTFTIPAGSTPDSLIAMADDSGSISYQVKDASNNFVGPDGTSGTVFTPDQPKLPASVSGTSIDARVTFSGTNPAGTPYLHAIGLQYAGGPIVHDSNFADFNAGLTKSGVNITDRPGTVFPQPATGTSTQDDFTTPPSDWLWSNTPPGTSTYSFTATPGSAEMSVATPTDTWAPGGPTEKPRAFLYKSTPVSGDFQLDTKIDMPAGRDTNRHQGLGVIQALPGGAPPDLNLDTTNLLNFGPYTLDNIHYMAILHGDNNGFGDAPHIAGYDANTYFLRLTKVGRTFTGYASTDGVNYTEVTSYTFSHDLPSMYVGFFSKAWGGSGNQVMDFDFFKFTTLITTGTFESRHMDLGATAANLMPLVASEGNTPDVHLQFRAADTEAGLASAPYVGPDGTAATSYSGTYSGTLTGMAGKRWFQYKAVLTAGTLLNDLAVVGVSNSTLPLSRLDAANALRIAAGIQSAGASDLARLDLVKGTSAGHITMEDAVAILRTVSGL